MAAENGEGAFTRPMTAQQAVLGELRRRILHGDLAPGLAIRQDSIAKELGVSRVPVREALRILEGEGQVVYQAHVGYHVTALDLDEVRELYQMRSLLENETLRVGVPRLTDEDVDHLEWLAEQIESVPADHVDAIAEVNREFHFLLFDAANLPRFSKHIRLLWDSSDAYRARYYMDRSQHATVHQEHRGIVEAARARDVDDVIAVFADHRQHALDFLAGMLTAQQPAERVDRDDV